MPVDQLDTRILRLLLEQPRTSVREYARVLGIARGTLQARLDRLERDGVITGTAPSLSPAALGHPVLAFVHVEVTQGRLDEVGDALAEVPEIVEAFSTTGGGDLLTRVVARDNAHLEDLVQTLISIPGVVRTRTEVALRERVRYRLLPLVAAVGRAAGPTPGQGTGGGGPTGPGTGGGGPTGPGTGGGGPTGPGTGGGGPTGPGTGGAGPGGGRG